MDGMLIIEDAVKTFRGFRAVDGISFEVDRGRIIINGIDVQEDAVGAMSDVGCVIETPEIYPDVTGRKYLEYLAKITGMTSESAASETDRVMEIVGISEYADRNVK